MIAFLKTKSKRPILTAISILIGFLLTGYAIAASTISNGELISPIIYLLQSDGDDEEFGSLIPGKLYSSAELALWKQRAQTGLHREWGDAYDGSYPDYRLAKSRAERLDQYASSMIRSGKDRNYILNLVNEGQITQEVAEGVQYFDGCVVVADTWYQKYDAYELNDFEYARDAAFVDLVEGTSKYTDTVKDILLTQVSQKCMDFSERGIFRTSIDQNPFWLYLEWLHIVFKTYDYLDSSVFNEIEKAAMDNWFKGAAQWAYHYAINRMEPVYEFRAANPSNSVIDLPDPSNPENTGYWLNRPQYAANRIRYEGSSQFWPAGSLINNRQLGQVNFIVHAGVKYDVNAWKKEGAQIVKEYISFHFDDNGYFAELDRSSDPNTSAGIDAGIPVNAIQGIAYGANTLVNVAEITHILYLDGFENLFEYKSKAKINEASGEIEQGAVVKSLEWVLLKFRQNFMLDNSPDIYPKGLTANQKNETTVIHFCKNTNYQILEKNDDIGRMYNPAVILNRYYKNTLIKDIYNASESYGNLCQYDDSDLAIKPGPHGILPATLFQYSDADEVY